MVRGKKSEKDLLEKKKSQEVEEVDVPIDVDIPQETPEEEESESFKKVLGDFKEEGGWVHVKRKKDGKIEKIGKYRPADFDKDELAKEYGGGTYFYVLRDNNGAIRARSEETYIDKKEQKTEQNSEFMQMAQIIKEQTKEIEALKSELLKPKVDNSQNIVLEMMRENQKNQVEILKAIATNNHPQQATSMTEMLTAITTIMTLMNKHQPQVEQPKNNIGDLVELAGLFADMKANGEPPKQETIMDVIKTFLTDGSLANVISMLKQPKSPMIKAPQNNQQQIEQSHQQPQETQEEQDTKIVCEFFKQYEKNLFNMKVDGNTAEDIASTIYNVISMNNDFKVIAYRFFKDIEKANTALLNVAVDFKNEQQLLKEIVETIHAYFNYDGEQDQTIEGGQENGETAN